jgi:hypothetical protein
MHTNEIPCRRHGEGAERRRVERRGWWRHGHGRAESGSGDATGELGHWKELAMDLGFRPMKHTSHPGLARERQWGMEEGAGRIGRRERKGGSALYKLRGPSLGEPVHGRLERQARDPGIPTNWIELSGDLAWKRNSAQQKSGYGREKEFLTSGPHAEVRAEARGGGVGRAEGIGSWAEKVKTGPGKHSTTFSFLFFSFSFLFTFKSPF